MKRYHIITGIIIGAVCILGAAGAALPVAGIIACADELLEEEENLLPEEPEIADPIAEQIEEYDQEPEQAQEDLPEPEEVGLIEEGEEVWVGAEYDLEQMQQAEDAAAAAAARSEMLAGLEIVLPAADQASIRHYLEGLTSEPSPTGSDGELAIAAYIEEEMKALGYTVTEQSFHEGFLNEELVDTPGVNIIVERGADAPEPTDSIIMIAAHYDMKKDAAQNDKSGAAAVMEAARILIQVESRADVCFLFFSGEEDGGYGALRFAESLDESLKSRVKGLIYVGEVAASEGPLLLGCKDSLGNLPAQIVRNAAETVIQRESQDDIWLEEETDMTQESETQAGSESVTEAETQEDEPVPPADFSFVKDPNLSRTYLEENNLTTVRLFRDVIGRYYLGEYGVIFDRFEGVPSPSPAWQQADDGVVDYSGFGQKTAFDEEETEDTFIREASENFTQETSEIITQVALENISQEASENITQVASENITQETEESVTEDETDFGQEEEDPFPEEYTQQIALAAGIVAEAVLTYMI